MLQTWQRWYQTINQKLITYIEKQTKGVYFSFLGDADGLSVKLAACCQFPLPGLFSGGELVLICFQQIYIVFVFVGVYMCVLPAVQDGRDGVCPKGWMKSELSK